MAITNFGTLKTAINDHVGETLTSYSPDLITFAQDYFDLNLRHREMVTSTDLSPTSGVFTLPSDYAQYRKVVEKASIRRPLTGITEDEADRIWSSRPAGLGEHFSITGNSLRVYPTITNDIELTYYAHFTAFSADEDTDWLLTKKPLVYMRACQMMAADFLKDDGEYAKYQSIVDRYIHELNSASQVGEFADVELALTEVAP